MSGVLIAAVGALKLVGGIVAGAGLVIGGTLCVSGIASGIANSKPARAIGGALKGAGQVIGGTAKKAWGFAKKIPVIGLLPKGIEWGVKKVAGIPGWIWKNAKKAPVVGRLCNIAEEKFYDLKAKLNKGFTELRAVIAKIKAKIVELVFKLLNTLGKETSASGKEAMDKAKKEKKEVSKAKGKSREAASIDRSKSLSHGTPEGVKTAAKGKAPVVADVAGKINSAKGVAVSGAVSPVIAAGAAGKELGKKAVEKPAGR